MARNKWVTVFGSLSSVFLTLFLTTAANSDLPRVAAPTQHPVKTQIAVKLSAPNTGCPTLGTVYLALGSYKMTGTRHIGYITATADPASPTLPAGKYSEEILVYDADGISTRFSIDFTTSNAESPSIYSGLEDVDPSWYPFSPPAPQPLPLSYTVYACQNVQS